MRLHENDSDKNQINTKGVRRNRQKENDTNKNETDMTDK